MGRLFSIAVALLCSTCAAAGNTSRGKLVERTGLAMGSELRLSAWIEDEPAAQAAFDVVFREFERLEALMSVWRKGSDVQRVNGSAGLRPVPVSADVRQLLREARQISEWTNGKFDVTFGALSDLWKFDHDQDNRVPDRRAVAERLPLVDYTAVRIDEQAGTVYLQRRGMRVHLGGIGKGYAIDRAAEILRRHRVGNFMIQAGGDLYVAGRRAGQPWRLAIRDPRGPADAVFAAIELSNATLSTSGDYERFFFHDGRRYHHILDPDRGEPARGCHSVSIITDRAVVADGLSTGVFILGPSAGMALIERLPNVEGVIVTERNEVLVSSGLRDRLIAVEGPTETP